MRKVLSILLIALMMVGMFTGCTTGAPAVNNAEQEGSLKDGTYVGNGKGNNGDIKVEMKVEGGKIAAVTVLEHAETPGLSDAAIKSIPEAIVDGQSIAVDTISGATNSSEGIIEAVRSCIEQAGGNPADFEIAGEAGTSDEVVELTTDVVVIGGGAAGIAASLRADELGLKTVLLEKMSFIGGAIAVSGGNQVVTLSELQKEAGVTDDSAESMVEDFLKNGANKNVLELTALFAENVGQTTDWLNKYVGIQYDMKGGLHKLAEYSHNRELAYEGGGPGFAEQARKKVQESGVEVYLQTRAEKLVTDGNGAVTGVVARDNTGKNYNIAAKAVIIATGGYGNNKDLLTDEMDSALYYGPSSSTGDGVIMATAQGIDAATRLMEYGKRYPNGIEVSEGIAKSTIAGNIAAFNESAILVNTAGKRVVNEKSSNRNILEVELSQENQMLYLLMDQSTFDIFRSKLSEAGISESSMIEWLENNGTATPYFFHADTVEELAAKAGMDASVLQSTVSGYNEFVKAGNDVDFGRPADYLKKEIGEGPYYLVEQKPRFASTMGGLVINTKLQVMNTSNEIIPGLFAAGEVVGGVMGDDSPSGANNAWALTAGKLSAEAVAEEIK
ncbi:MAG: FAD-dependent oxidoreductase [Sedimentibacter sp.]|uniref:FAD-dependent oxidoreductase n=1 Tax=Sedimentibacter sp. TaxID=1960295 RepID=UPI00315950F9